MIATYASLYNQRIGQLIDNVLVDSGYTITNLFYMEDDKLLELLSIYAVKHPPQIKERSRHDT